VLTARNGLGRQFRRLRPWLRAGDRECTRERRLGAALARVARGGETPCSADAHAHADALVLVAMQLVDLAVARGDELRALAHEADIRVRATNRSGLHELAQTLPHGRPP
jgi:hypothetical protein